MERYELLSLQSLYKRIQLKLIKHTGTCIISALGVFPESKRKSDQALVTYLCLFACSNNEDTATESRKTKPGMPAILPQCTFCLLVLILVSFGSF